MSPREKMVLAKAPKRGDENFGNGLAAAARSIIADARRALINSKLPDAEAVHNIRKALKRWRALMRLLESPFGEQADQMRLEARDLMRALARARDFQSALDAAKDLRKGDTPLSKVQLQTISRRLTTLRDEAEAKSFTKNMHERLLHYLNFAALSLEQWPLDAIDLETVADGLTATYRRARKLIPKKWGKANAKHLHSLRQRVVEHRHQMDLIEPLWPHRGKVWRRKVQRLRNLLGACQDLTVLANFTDPHKPLAAWRSSLKPAIDARRKSHLKSAARLSNRLFAETPKAFHKCIAALLTRRQSKAPWKKAGGTNRRMSWALSKTHHG